MKKVLVHMEFALQPIESEAAVLQKLMELSGESLESLRSRYRKDKNGRPYVEDSQWFFSISHTREAMALAFSNEHFVGVDIESQNREPRSKEIAERFFHGRESEWLSSLEVSARAQGFLKIWTAKEAIFKCDQRSFGSLLKTIDLTNFAKQNEISKSFFLQNLESDFSLISFAQPSLNLIGTLAGKGELDFKLLPSLQTES